MHFTTSQVHFFTSPSKMLIVRNTVTIPKIASQARTECRIIPVAGPEDILSMVINCNPERQVSAREVRVKVMPNDKIQINNE